VTVRPVADSKAFRDNAADPITEPSGVGTKATIGLSEVPVLLAAVTVSLAYNGLTNIYSAASCAHGLELVHVLLSTR